MEKESSKTVIQKEELRQRLALVSHQIREVKAAMAKQDQLARAGRKMLERRRRLQLC